MIVRRRDELKTLVKQIRANYSGVMLTNGCFDLLHYAHIKHLRNLKSHVKKTLLVVAVNSDSSVLQYKGKAPAVEEIERAIAVDELSSVDIVYIMQDSNPENLIADIQPEYYAKGHDWPLESLPEKELLDALGITYLCDTTTKGLTTTSKLKDRIISQ